MKLNNKHILLQVILSVVILIVTATVAAAGDRMYFSGFNETNASTGEREVILVWGEMEGAVPADISSFRIYRKSGSSDFDPSPIAEIPNMLVGSSTLAGYFSEPGQENAREEMIRMLDDMVQDTTVDSSNYLTYLYNLLDNTHPDFSRFKQLLMVRFSSNAARASGRAFKDSSPGTEINTYIITGIRSGVETKPLGKTVVQAGTDTVLPIPANFRQVYVGGCSDINAFMDHEKVHFNWDVPTSPETIALRTMVYGYDIYRSESNLGALDLRSTIPVALTRINDVPVVVSGNTAADGPDAFLATDGGHARDGDPLTGGTQYFYYLVARDLTGNYSATAGPLDVTVPDREDPVMPWNVHTQREMDLSVSPAEPRLTLVWDQINADNYKGYYRQDKVFCPASPSGKVCWTKTGTGCDGDERECTDIDVDHYIIYRFASFQEAREWGTDSDGDLWPDDIETANGSDPCDKASVPPLVVTNPVIDTINFGDNTRDLPETGKRIHFYRDTIPAADNTVYWYRISSVDSNDNQSALSPPVRGALWDRTQPVADPYIRTTRCRYETKNLNMEECENAYQDVIQDAVLNIYDDTGDARRFQLYERCFDKVVTLRLLYSGPINKHAVVSPEDLGNYNCDAASCRGDFRSYIIRFFGDERRLLAESEPLQSEACLTSPAGCVQLFKQCDTVEIHPEDPEIHPIDPDDPFVICANLTEGQCARVYRKINGKMTPIESFCYSSGGSCSGNIDLTGIVTTDVCLGVRVFSENGVGSGMVYFNCIPVLTSTPPKAPLMESVNKQGDPADPSFDLRWSSQSAGISAFIVSMESEAGLYYHTFWDLVPDSETGQFTATVKIDPATVTNDWCFKVRAMDSTLTMSDWSDTRCKVWGAPEPGESLGWPQVKTPAESGEIIAIKTNGNSAPLLLLSDDLTDRIAGFEADCPLDLASKRCPVDGSDIPLCEESTECLSTSSQFCCDICGVVRSWNSMGSFVVYRQEENKDFLKVSPLVETVFCKYEENENNQFSSTVNDPFIHILSIGGGAVSNYSTDDAGIISGIGGSTRMVFADWFPYKSGSKVRYKVVVFGEGSMEPEEIYTSGWITLP